MRRALVCALVAALFALPGCSGVDEPLSEKPVTPSPTKTQQPPTATPSPEVTEQPADDGWDQLDFAYGFGSVVAPIGLPVQATLFSNLGAAPRFGGGYLGLKQADGTTVDFILKSAAGVPGTQSGPPCGSEVIEVLPGAPGVPTPHDTYVVASAFGTQHAPAVFVMISTTPPVGDKCGPGAQVAVPEGGFVSSLAIKQFSEGATMDDAVVWINSDAGKSAIRMVRSVRIS